MDSLGARPQFRGCVSDRALRERSASRSCEFKRSVREKADMFKKQIAEMQSKEKCVRKEMVREHRQELEEQERRAREEADALRNSIAEMQSNLEDAQHRSNKALNSQHVPSHPTV